MVAMGSSRWARSQCRGNCSRSDRTEDRSERSNWSYDDRCSAPACPGKREQSSVVRAGTREGLRSPYESPPPAIVRAFPELIWDVGQNSLVSCRGSRQPNGAVHRVKRIPGVKGQAY